MIIRCTRRSSRSPIYNPNGRTQGKQNQLNKTNVIGTAVDFLRMSGLTHYQPPVAVALGWMLQSGRWIL